MNILVELIQCIILTICVLVGYCGYWFAHLEIRMVLIYFGIIFIDLILDTITLLLILQRMRQTITARQESVNLALAVDSLRKLNHTEGGNQQ